MNIFYGPFTEILLEYKLANYTLQCFQFRATLIKLEYLFVFRLAAISHIMPFLDINVGFHLLFKRKLF